MPDGASRFQSGIHHPWVEAFRDRPDDLLHEFLQGAAHIPPYGLADPVEVAPQLFTGLTRTEPALFDVFDTALEKWLVRERKHPPEYRTTYGLKSYARMVTDAFTVAQILGPPRTLTRLRDEYFLWRSWSANVRSGAARDALAAYLFVLADHPISRRFEQEWIRLASDVGRGRRESHYLDVALRGLGRLPATETLPTEDARIAAIMAGLSHWAAGLGPDGRDAFRDVWHSLRWMYALPGKEAWTDLLAPIWHRYEGRPFVAWWKTELGVAGPVRSGRRAQEPRKADVDDLLKEMSAKGPGGFLMRIDRLLHQRLAWAEQTGDTFHLVVHAGRFGNALLTHRQSAEAEFDFVRRWMEICVGWEPNNEIIWHLWGRALRHLGDAAGAEVVFWAARRRLPDKEHTVVELARTLIVQDRWGEAEALLRAAAYRFPDKEACHAELARLLIARGPDRWGEAEAVLRRYAADHKDSEPIHVELARLLAARGGAAAGAALLSAFVARGDRGAGTLNQLGHLHLHAGDLEPALALLERLQTMKAQRQAQQLSAAIDRAKAAWARGEAFVMPPLNPEFGKAPKEDARGRYPVPEVIRRIDGPVTRADFGLDDGRRALIGEGRREELRKELERLLDQIPDSGYAAVVAFRHGVHTPTPERLSALPNAYALRLAVYLKAGDEGRLRALRDEVRGRAPLADAALAALEDTDGIDDLAGFLAKPAPVADPAVADLHAALPGALAAAGVKDRSRDGIADALAESPKARAAVRRVVEGLLTRIDMDEALAA